MEFQVLQAIAAIPEVAERVSLATVKVEIIDTNDNNHVFFELKEYKIRDLKSSIYPEIFLQVNATDKDSGKFGPIVYIVIGDGADLFVIEALKTGVIIVTSNVSLDRKQKLNVP